MEKPGVMVRPVIVVGQSAPDAVQVLNCTVTSSVNVEKASPTYCCEPPKTPSFTAVWFVMRWTMFGACTSVSMSVMMT